MTRFSLFCHRGEDGLLDMHRELRIELPWGNGLFCHMLIHHAYHIGSDEWSLSGQEFVSDATQSVLIAFRTGDAAKLLWCHILRGTGNGALLVIDGSKHLRDTEIGQESFPFGIEQDILRFEVTMHNALLMHILKRLP